MDRSMMKRISVLLILCLICGTSLVPVCSAAIELNRFYTVSASGERALQGSFETTEKPWLYVRFDPPATGTLNYIIDITLTKWTDPAGDGIGTDHRLNKTTFNSDNEFWFSFSDDIWFGTPSTEGIAEGGLWKIGGISFLFGGVNPARDAVQPGQIYFGGTNFFVNSAVAPEPMSAALFALGLGVLAARRKKKAAGR